MRFGYLRSRTRDLDRVIEFKKHRGRDGFLSRDGRQDSVCILAAIGGASGLGLGGAIGAGNPDGGGMGVS